MIIIGPLLILTATCFATQQTKAGINLFDHVYTINLPQSVDRKEHVINEFKKLGVTNYEIFIATDKDSPEVANIMQTSFVKKYPPCFRCGKKICDCSNNILIKPQIGNWLSFIKVFKDIVKNDYQFVLITEDDVKFTDDAPKIFAELINYKKFAKYNIDLKKPLLIRFEKRGGPAGDISKICFTKEITMSNACFMVNKKYAESFLKNLKVIDHTSDVYIQENILKLDPSIQHFTAYPHPAYQLSDGPKAVFYSEIHPKGIDLQDMIRVKQHKKRISYWEYILNRIRN